MKVFILSWIPVGCLSLIVHPAPSLPRNWRSLTRNPLRLTATGANSKMDMESQNRAFGSGKRVVCEAASDVVLDVEIEAVSEGDEGIAAPGRLSRIFDVLKVLGNLSLILQLALIFFGNRNPKLAPLFLPIGHGLQQYVWTLIAYSYVCDVLSSATKQGRLQGTTFRLINIAILASIALLIASGSSIPYSILAVLAIPSALALRNCSLSGLLEPMRLFDKGSDVPMVAVAYGVLAWEACFSAFQSPSSLPLLRAAILHRLHHAAVNDRLESETYGKLNDSLFYSAFGSFPDMSQGITPAFIVPIATVLLGSTKGSASIKQKQKLREQEAAKEKEEAKTEDAKEATVIQ